MRIAESQVIRCRECKYEFGTDDAKVCWKCHEHICPKCGACGCWTPFNGFEQHSVKRERSI